MRILLTLFDCRGVDSVIPEVIREAAGVHPVAVLQVLDPAHADKLCRKLRTDGWLGASKSQELGDKVSEDYRVRFDETIDRLCTTLRDQDLDVTHLTEPGDIVNTTLRIAEDLGDVGLIIIGRPQRSLIERWFDHMNTKVLMDRAPCEVRIIGVRD